MSVISRDWKLRYDLKTNSGRRNTCNPLDCDSFTDRKVARDVKQTYRAP